MPDDESNGECDCNSDAYMLDFKLAVSETAMRGKNLFSESVCCLTNGVVIYGSSKINSSNPKYKPIKATRLHAALRHLTLDELKQIRQSNDKKQGMNTDIKCFLETLETKKNILLFFPYEFYTEQKTEFKENLKEIVDIINQDFNISLNYRKALVPQYDTYFVFIYNKHFVIEYFDNNKLNYVEAIDEKNVPTYLKLKSYVWFTEL